MWWNFSRQVYCRWSPRRCMHMPNCTSGFAFNNRLTNHVFGFCDWSTALTWFTFGSSIASSDRKTTSFLCSSTAFFFFLVVAGFFGFFTEKDAVDAQSVVPPSWLMHNPCESSLLLLLLLSSCSKRFSLFDESDRRRVRHAIGCSWESRRDRMSALHVFIVVQRDVNDVQCVFVLLSLYCNVCFSNPCSRSQKIPFPDMCACMTSLRSLFNKQGRSYLVLLQNATCVLATCLWIHEPMWPKKNNNCYSRRGLNSRPSAN